MRDEMTLLKGAWLDVSGWSHEHRYAFFLRRMGYITGFPIWEMKTPKCNLCDKHIPYDLTKEIIQHFKDVHPVVFAMAVLAEGA